MDYDIKELGVVYCLSNKSFPGWFKIGKTDALSAEGRAKQLSNTSVPFPYEVEFAKRVFKSHTEEAKAHKYFANFRVNNYREFFELPLTNIAKYFNDNIKGHWDPKPNSNLISITTNKNLNLPIIREVSNKIITIPNTVKQNTLTQTIKSQPVNIKIHKVKINNLSTEETDFLINKCLEFRCIELKLFKGYHFIDDIIYEKVKLTSDMIFNAVLNSPYIGYLNVVSDNFHEIIQELISNSPQSFIELRQCD
jgi:hypothetical protein